MRFLVHPPADNDANKGIALILELTDHAIPIADSAPATVIICIEKV